MSVSRGNSHQHDRSIERGSTATAPAYVQIPLPEIDIERHAFLTVRDRQNLELITVMELLSPSNKSGPDRAQYLDKRRRYLATGINLVELDLLRGGARLPLDDLRPCDYYALVSRREEQPKGAIWAFPIRDRLPTIPIPLRPADGDAKLDLQEILDRVYDEAGYENYIYRTPPKPPLSAENAAWATAFTPAGARS